MSDRKRLYRSLLLVVLIGGMMLFAEKSATNENIIIPLELATSLQMVMEMLSPFSRIQLDWLKTNTQLDFIFLIMYTSVYYYTTKSLLTRLNKESIIKIILPFTLVAGVLDAIENLFILQFLNLDFSTPYFSVYYWCVHIKFVFVALFTLIALIELGCIIRESIVKKKELA